MRFSIDCEFNEFKGELISMALCPESGGLSFYEVLPCENPGPWVAKHVMPITGKDPISIGEFQTRLQQYLMAFDSVHIVADWPEDIKHFCEALITGPGERLNTPPLSMEVVRIDTVSPMPHNALGDALALRNAVFGHAKAS